MSHKSKNFVRSILLNEEFESRDSIREALLPLYESTTGSMANKLAITLMLAEDAKSDSIEEQLDHIKKNFASVVGVIEQYEVKLPEEEVALEAMVASMFEEGEMNVTAGIDASTPRIYPKKKKKEDNEQY